jgi:hypothetical protein
MTARKRKHGESFKKYRKNLIKEASDLKFRLSRAGAKVIKAMPPSMRGSSHSSKMRAYDGTMDGPMRSSRGG